MKFLKHEINNGTAIYKISVTDITSRETWFIYKRYSELLNIHELLIKSNLGIIQNK